MGDGYIFTDEDFPETSVQKAAVLAGDRGAGCESMFVTGEIATEDREKIEG